MVIGNSTNGLYFYNIFQPGSTIASAMLSGINEASGFGYDIRFSLGIVLMRYRFNGSNCYYKFNFKCN